MAEIHVEKRHHSVWPWILGLIALALLLWAVFAFTGEQRTEVAPLGATEERVLIENEVVEDRGVQEPLMNDEPVVTGDAVLVEDDEELEEEL